MRPIVPDGYAPVAIGCTGRYAGRGARMTDPGLYGPGSEAWRLNREAMLLLGAGPRALLLQIAHPAVAAGVNDHSDFRADPWRRLAGTLRSYLTIVYGTTGRGARRDPPAQRAPSRDHRARLRGARPGALAVGPRDARRLDDRRRTTRGSSRCRARDARRYYEETRPIGRAFGVPDALLPRRSRGVRRVRRGDARRRTARSASRRSPASSPAVVLRPPLAPLAPLLPLPTAAARTVLAAIPAGAYAWTLWPSVGLLPPIRPRGLRAAVGPASGRVGLARRRLAGLAAAAPSVPQMPRLCADRGWRAR